MRPLTVLHLSDLHRTEDEPVANSEIVNALIADFGRFEEDDVPPPSALIVSGDLTQRSLPQEYDEARELLDRILDFWNIDSSRALVVPGNHDINWSICDELFRTSRTKPENIATELIIENGPLWLHAGDYGNYKRRFRYFLDFYKAFMGKSYPEETDFTILRLDDEKVAFVGLNSCHLVDYLRKAGSISPQSILGACDSLEDFEGAVFGVWHHDLDWRHEGREDAISHGTLEAIAQRVFAGGVCGHRHRPYSAEPVLSLNFPVIAAGSLCAGPRQRSEGQPRSYNVLHFDSENSVRVHVRKKVTRTSPWTAMAEWRDEAGHHVSYYDVPLTTSRSGVAPTPKSRAVTVVRPTAPFEDSNARRMPRRMVLDNYFWTEVSRRVDTSKPQIIYGPRGSGKTALLLTLTLEGRVRSPYCERHPEAVLKRVGVLVSIQISDATMFSGKEWLSEPEKVILFNAFTASILAGNLFKEAMECAIWARQSGRSAPTESELAAVFDAHLGLGATTHRELEDKLARYRVRIREGLSIIEYGPRMALTAELQNSRLYGNEIELYRNIAAELAQWEVFRDTQWSFLFDEVEYLNFWQQKALYRFFAATNERVSSKIATLPYCHGKVLGALDPPLARGHDYDEVPLAHGYIFSKDTISDPLKFYEVAENIWEGRLSPSIRGGNDLKAVWPLFEPLAVFAEYPGQFPETRDALLEGFLADLEPSVAENARLALSRDRKEFKQKYWSQYGPSFLHRLAVKGVGEEAPLYWGWRMLLKACDTNCRWFLMLADECWARFWRADGIRPLTALEQHEAIVGWAENIANTCGLFGKEAEELKEIADRIANAHRNRLYGKPKIGKDMWTVAPSAFGASQANAIALGIAYGFFVPRLHAGGEERHYVYPDSDIALRLGYPLAIKNGIPLREGDDLKIGDLSQVVMPWWRE